MLKNGFKDLIVWQKSILLVQATYKVTKQLPKHEQFILASQMIRASISIPSNIAEGYRRFHTNEYIRFTNYAYGSAGELETQIIIARKIYPLVDYTDMETLVIQIQKMLFSMLDKLKKNGE